MSDGAHAFDRAGAKRIVSATKLVENHLTPTQTPGGKQTSRDQFFVKLGTNISDNKWNADQVEWDGTDDLDTFTDGEEWDSSIPIYVIGEPGSVGDILLAESIAANDADSGTVWIALKIAGGGSTGFADLTGGSGSSYTGNIYDDYLKTNPAIETSVSITAIGLDFGDLSLGGNTRLAHKISDVWYINPPVFGG